MMWDEDDIKLALSLWNDKGKSAAQIGEQFGITRNATLGRIDRLRRRGYGFAVRDTSRRVGRRGAPAPAPTFKAARTPVPPQFRSNPPPPQSEVDRIVAMSAEGDHPPDMTRKAISDIEPGDCRWPLGDPQQSDFAFCGSKAAPGLPYCSVHAKRACKSVSEARNTMNVNKKKREAADVS